MPVVSVPRATLFAAIVVDRVISPVPSKLTPEAVTSPDNAIDHAVAKAVAVSATTPLKLLIKVLVTLASIAEFALASV